MNYFHYFKFLIYRVRFVCFVYFLYYFQGGGNFLHAQDLLKHHHFGDMWDAFH